MLRAQIAHATQRLTVSGERLTLSARALLRQRRDRFAGLAIRLKASKLANAQAQRNAITRDRERTLRLAERAHRALTTLVQRQQARVQASSQLLAALSYRSVLARGFALVRDEQGAALACRGGGRVRAHGSASNLPMGAWRVIADGDRAPVAKPAPKRVAPKIDQGTLF